jgi:DNA-binding CsgD family transcriptional regulator/tetratricopeptide (TPR) repeat protein
MRQGTRQGRLLERDGELDELAQLVASAAEGAGRLAVVEGPAGIGKSTLLRSLGERVAAKARVLWATASPLEQPLGFGVVLQLLADEVEHRAEGDDAFWSGHLAPVRPLFDATAQGGSAASDAGLDRSVAVMRGLHALVASACASGPLLVVVDDVQWADEPSVRFLHYLTRRFGDLPVAIALGLRAGEPAEERAVSELAAHPAATHVSLPPLSRAAVDGLVRAQLPRAEDGFCAACLEVTGGNPLYVRELLSAVHAEGLEPTAAAAERLAALNPPALRRHLLVRLGRLPDPARALAFAAAITGDGAELRRAARVAGVDIGAAHAAADVLVGADLLASVDPVAFTHPLIRETVRAEIPEGQRSAGHLEAARALHADAAEPERVAAHLLRAIAGREAWIVQVLVRAAEQARARGAPSSAAQYLERALREGGGLERRGEILFELGLAEATAGSPRGVELIREAAAELADSDQRALALMNLGRILGIRGRFAASAEVFAVAAAELEGTDSPFAWWAAAGEAMSGSHDPTRRERSRAQLEELLGRDDLDALPIGRAVLGFAALERLYAAEPRARVLELARRAAGTLGSVDEDGVAFRIAAMATASCGELEEAETLARRFGDAAGAQGSALELAALEFVHLLIALGRGDVAQIRRRAQASLDGARLGWGIGLPRAAGALALAQLEGGDPETAARTLESWAREPGFREDFEFPHWLEARGHVLLEAGRPTDALAEFERAGEIFTELGLVSPAISFRSWRSGAAVAAARAGDRGRAVELAERDAELARSAGALRALGTALRALGVARGGERGIELLEKAVAGHERSGTALEEARSLLELGSALRRSGRRRDARAVLRRAQECGRACGAVAVVERATEELSASGARLLRVALTGVAALTPSERRVAGLAAQGLTNRQVAERLVISPKTVEHHLGSVYRKLGISSRAQLADALDP